MQKNKHNNNKKNRKGPFNKQARYIQKCARRNHRNFAKVLPIMYIIYSFNRLF